MVTGSTPIAVSALLDDLAEGPINGVILFDETLRQPASDGTPRELTLATAPSSSRP